MKYLKTDTEIKKIEEREEFQEYLDFRKENDKWIIPYTNEMAMVGILNEPLTIPEVCKENGIEQNDSALECINDTGLFLTLPDDGKREIYPTRFTAFSTICKRAGIFGPMISLTKKSGERSPLPLQEKAMLLTRGFSLNAGKSKVLLRDEKISATLSNRYEILPAWELIEILEKQLKKDHPDFKFKEAEISHEYLLVKYYFNDIDADAFLLSKLQELGVAADTVKTGLVFATSDIGYSQVTAYLFYEIDGVPMRLGDKIGVRHDCSNTVEDFQLKLENLGVLLKECEDQVENLGNIEIKDFLGCLRNIVETNETIFPKTIADEVITELSVTHPMEGTAIEVYLALTEIIERFKVSRNLSPTRYLDLSEKTAKFLFADFSAYDEH